LRLVLASKSDCQEKNTMGDASFDCFIFIMNILV
jgi:hypothetical protein